jgi:hypothetical protein
MAAMLGQPLLINNSRETCKMRLCAVRGLNAPDVRFCLVGRVSDSRLCMAVLAHPLSAWAALADGAGVHHERVTIKLAGGEAEAQHYPPLTFDLEYERLDVYDISESRALVAAHRTVELDAPVVAADLAIYRARAATLVAQHWRWVEQVALSLARERRLTGVQVLALRSQRA